MILSQHFFIVFCPSLESITITSLSSGGYVNSDQLLEDMFGAHNYAPLPVVLAKGKGCYVWDIADKRYLDMMSAYSAVSHGHCHPEIVKALIDQVSILNVTSRAYFSNRLGLFLKKACQTTGFERALPMNTGAEAVETAIKGARKWGYNVKGVKSDHAEIIACQGNFHGRTTTIVSFSSEKQYKEGFGPLTPGFKLIPYNDPAALERAITPNTVAFLVEPIQGEAGIIVPDAGYLTKCASICKKNNVLFLVDEIQTGLGRTGELLAINHENVQADGLMLGKALGGGILPVSLFLAKKEIMDLFKPGDHGSTFGGNPLAATVALRALEVLEEEGLASNAKAMGNYFINQLKKIKSPLIKEVRGKGLMIGIEIDPAVYSAHEVCLRLLDKGILTKDTHQTVIRLAPPLIINQSQLDQALQIITQVFSEITATLTI